MLFPYKSRLRDCWKNHFPADVQTNLATTSGWTRQQTVIAWSTLVLVSAVLLIPNLSYPLIEPDETRYAQIAIEMNESRDWVTPTLDGRAYLDKPPLLYWVTALSLSIFGNHETAARLPSMLAAFSTIVLTFGWGSRIVGQRAAWLAAISIVLCGGFIMAGRFQILDSLFAFLTTMCMLSGYIAIREHRHRWAWWMVSGVGCALGVLTKGPVALVLCAPPLILNGWLRADQTRTRIPQWIAFVLPIAVICVPWYVAVASFNSQFVNYFFWEHNFKRFTQGSNHQQPFWFYLPVVFAAMFPASLLLPSVGVFLLRRCPHKQSRRSTDLGFLFCGAVWMLAFFTAASCKLPTYILPAIPLLCLMTGVMLDQTVFRPGSSDRITKYLRPFPQRATLILVASCLALVSTNAWLNGELSGCGGIAVATCIVVTVRTFTLWNREAAFSKSAWAATSTVAIGVLCFASSVLLPTISTKRSVFVEARRLADADPDSSIVFFGEKPHSASFHLPVKRIIYFPSAMEDEFTSFVARQRSLILVTDDNNIETTRRSLAGTHELLVSPNHEHVYQAKRIIQPVIEIAGIREVSR